MAGRRRRVSNSTVATFDESHVRYVPENEILRPIDAGDEDYNEWWCFYLTEAVVLRKDGKTLANPLLVNSEGPFIIRGKLVIRKADRPYLKPSVKPSAKSAYIEIEASWLYSIGYNELALWVSGAAGWFEIVPATNYEGVYCDIRQAITLYYEIMDICKAEEAYVEEYANASKGKKKKMKPPKSPSLDTLFLKYAIAIGDGVFRHEVEERCHRWAEFLINHFPKESEFDWSQTLFHKWIIEKHPDIHKKCLKAARSASAAGTASAAKQGSKYKIPASTTSRLERSQTRGSSTGRRQDTEDSPSVTTPLSTGRGRGTKPESSTGSQSPRSGMATPSLPSIPTQSLQDRQPTVERLLELLEEISQECSDFKRVKWITVNSKIYTKCKIKDYKTPTEILHFYSTQLLEQIPAKWRDTIFYEELSDAAKQPPKPFEITSLETIPSQLVRRDPKPRKAPAAPGPSSNEVPLRPHPAVESSGDASDDGSRRGYKYIHRRGPGRPAGKAAGLRLKTSSKKRTASEMENDSSAQSGRSVKRSHPLTEDDDDDDEEESSDEMSDVETPAYGDEEEEEADRDDLAMPPPSDAVRIVVHAEKIPSMSPSGPNGTWICDQEECGFVVRSAEDEAGKALIQQHFRDHESQAEMMDLAVSEGRRGHVPINHLLAKIQGMGKTASASEHQTANGDILAAPIKRRLLI